MKKEETAGKRYTAQELRNSADNCDWRTHPCIVAMLRQAADAEEELERALKNEKALELRVDFWRREHNALKARLEAVIKEFTQFKKDVDDRLTEAYVFAHEITANSSFDKIYGGVRDAVNGIRKELGIDSAASGEEDNTGKEHR